MIDEEVSTADLTYELFPGGTTRGRDMLCDSHGHTYCLKSVRTPNVTKLWRCSKLTITARCPADVLSSSVSLYPDEW